MREKDFQEIIVTLLAYAIMTCIAAFSINYVLDIFSYPILRIWQALLVGVLAPRLIITLAIIVFLLSLFGIV